MPWLDVQVAPFAAPADGRSHKIQASYSQSQANDTFPSLRQDRNGDPDPTGDVDRSAELDWAWIQEGVNRVKGRGSGGTVFLPAGRYVIDRPLDLSGASGV